MSTWIADHNTNIATGALVSLSFITLLNFFGIIGSKKSKMETNWTTNNIPDQSGHVVIITGANVGLGYSTARAFAQKGAHVILACRNAKKGQAAVDSIVSDYPNAKVELQLLDLSDLDSVKSFSTQFMKKNDKLHALILNAGVMVPPKSETKQGFEIQIGVNHLAHFALTGHLLPLLKQTKNSRVVTLSSTAADIPRSENDFNLNDLMWKERVYRTWTVYGCSKLCNQLFCIELHRRFTKAGLGIVSVACHPGWSQTDLQRTSYLFSALNFFFGQPAELGCLPTLRAAVDPNVKGGEYYGPNGRKQLTGYPVKVEMTKMAKNEDYASRLFDMSEELTGVKYDF